MGMCVCLCLTGLALCNTESPEFKLRSDWLRFCLHLKGSTRPPMQPAAFRAVNQSTPLLTTLWTRQPITAELGARKCFSSQSALSLTGWNERRSLIFRFFPLLSSTVLNVSVKLFCYIYWIVKWTMKCIICNIEQLTTSVYHCSTSRKSRHKCYVELFPIKPQCLHFFGEV